MPPRAARWQIAPPIPPQIQESLQAYPPILRQLLFNRGYVTHEAARLYLQAANPYDTNPELMLGIPQAVERIQWAIKRHEAIAIYGDYDVDGVTATALLTEALRSQGAQARGYIPNRFDEGYGLNNEALEGLYSEGTRLVITVDCGIRSLKEAEHARRLGLDMIISDHHHPANELPEAWAIINPKQPGDVYPFKELAGVGLAYKLAQALLGVDNPQLQAYHDLVALGTVADLAPLLDENRALVRAGLERIRNPGRQGLSALMGVSRLQAQRVTAGDIGFALGPRLNAAGRLDSAQAALELLLTRDVYIAGELAQLLEIQNRERQKVTLQIQEHAEQAALADNPDGLLLFAANPDYNRGVVGLAASRLTERYYRPAIVAQIGDEFTRGSCRSIPEFHITDALDQCCELLDHYGGHAAAAGFTVPNRNLAELIARLQSIARQQLGEFDLRPTLKADAELQLSDLKPSLLKHLDYLQPTGQGNPQATFVTRGLKVRRSRPVGKDNSHLKLVVTDGVITYDAIAFRMGDLADELPSEIDLLYVFEANEYNGNVSLQLNVRDLRPTGSPH